MLDFEEIAALDLFSGTGSISYELASRGIRSVTSVEINAVHHRFIQETARELGITNLYAVRANAFLYIKGCKKQFGLIFADPPYDITGSEMLPEMVFSNGLLAPGGVFILEHSKNLDFSSHPKFSETRSYGSVHFSFFKN
jgi:16S rRNA G966 N2-methylase RsmD